MKKINVLICDDSALMRRSLKKIIESDPDLSVIAIARDGEDAVNKARELKPDVVTMDVNMPGMDGITALQIIVNEKIAPVLMVSALTQKGAVDTFEAMELGAFDYVSKPGGTISLEMGTVAHEIVSKIKASVKPGTTRKLSRRISAVGSSLRLEPTKRLESAKRLKRRIEKAKNREITTETSSDTGPGFKAVAIGISTGGPRTLFDVLPFLPADLPAAVFLVQHMPAPFISPYAKRLDSNCPMRCVEVEAGMTVEPGTIYLARGGYHMIPYSRLTGKIQIRTPKKPEHLFMPSVDIMMEGVLQVFGADTVGVLMTGMGRDGAESMVKIVQAGGITIAESEESAIVFGMPAEAIEMGGANIIAPSWDIAKEIIKAVNRH